MRAGAPGAGRHEMKLDRSLIERERAGAGRVAVLQIAGIPGRVDLRPRERAGVGDERAAHFAHAGARDDAGAAAQIVAGQRRIAVADEVEVAVERPSCGSATDSKVVSKRNAGPSIGERGRADQQLERRGRRERACARAARTARGRPRRRPRCRSSPAPTRPASCAAAPAARATSAALQAGAPTTAAIGVGPPDTRAGAPRCAHAVPAASASAAASDVARRITSASCLSAARRRARRAARATSATRRAAGRSLRAARQLGRLGLVFADADRRFGRVAPQPSVVLGDGQPVERGQQPRVAQLLGRRDTPTAAPDTPVGAARVRSLRPRACAPHRPASPELRDRADRRAAQRFGALRRAARLRAPARRARRPARRARAPRRPASSRPTRCAARDQRVEGARIARLAQRVERVAGDEVRRVVAQAAATPRRRPVAPMTQRLGDRRAAPSDADGRRCAAAPRAPTVRATCPARRRPRRRRPRTDRAPAHRRARRGRRGCRPWPALWRRECAPSATDRSAGSPACRSVPSDDVHEARIQPAGIDAHERGLARAAGRRRCATQRRRVSAQARLARQRSLAEVGPDRVGSCATKPRSRSNT